MNLQTLLIPRPFNEISCILGIVGYDLEVANLFFLCRFEISIDGFWELFKNFDYHTRAKKSC